MQDAVSVRLHMICNALWLSSKTLLQNFLQNSHQRVCTFMMQCVCLSRLASRTCHDGTDTTYCLPGWTSMIESAHYRLVRNTSTELLTHLYHRVISARSSGSCWCCLGDRAGRATHRNPMQTIARLARHEIPIGTIHADIHISLASKNSLSQHELSRRDCGAVVTVLWRQDVSLVISVFLFSGLIPSNHWFETMVPMSACVLFRARWLLRKVSAEIPLEEKQPSDAQPSTWIVTIWSNLDEATQLSLLDSGNVGVSNSCEWNTISKLHNPEPGSDELLAFSPRHLMVPQAAYACVQAMECDDAQPVSGLKTLPLVCMHLLAILHLLLCFAIILDEMHLIWSAKL